VIPLLDFRSPWSVIGLVMELRKLYGWLPVWFRTGSRSSKLLYEACASSSVPS